MQISINSDQQWVLKRQCGGGRPAVLWVHGGPGSTLMPFSHEFDADLLRFFDIIHWDQRASGKSYRSNISMDAISLKVFADDLEKLLEVLPEVTDPALSKKNQLSKETKTVLRTASGA